MEFVRGFKLCKTASLLVAFGFFAMGDFHVNQKSNCSAQNDSRNDDEDPHESTTRIAKNNLSGIQNLFDYHF
jgi:hypothetical protein